MKPEVESSPLTTVKAYPHGRRGFASMDPEIRREIARMGGKAVPPQKRAFSQDVKLASKAGKQGGKSVPPERRSFSVDRELASRAGKKAGHTKSE
jgi:general stress protein YciG